ncbi:TetR family transcriptional regulator [Spongiactinospora sp. TRM90649]|uniref:TetR/AcrR family transcriptional regulator n=1 Tax=Spongiactinospora sp. TRM90649 TaxID=3031114 RepID=UPI0023F98535|nr:TetR family transcriptional regulator [Spongiactinospora sp. TRM90649]MDF5757372.1 TetR family transcriptional regulator [Spongiactinospora sp. TRM90649]
MPRIADHDQRRAQIARAFQRLLAAEGFAGVSFSRVAAEAGVSVGLIQYYFTGKDALLRFAYEDGVSRMSERVRARVRDGEDAGLPMAEVLLDSLAELLPLDEERAVEYRVRQGLQTQAVCATGLPVWPGVDSGHVQSLAPDRIGGTDYVAEHRLDFWAHMP